MKPGARERAERLRQQADAAGRIAVDRTVVPAYRYKAAVLADDLLDQSAEQDFLARVQEMAR